MVDFLFEFSFLIAICFKTLFSMITLFFLSVTTINKDSIKDEHSQSYIKVCTENFDWLDKITFWVILYLLIIFSFDEMFVYAFYCAICLSADYTKWKIFPNMIYDKKN